MEEPTVRTSRLAIAAGFGVALLVGIGGFLAGRATLPPPSPAPTPVVVAPPPAKPAPDASRILARADLASASAQAADAFASGKALPQAVSGLPGRRFSLALPFGCTGPAGTDSGAPLRWRYDDVAHALRIHVALVGWQADEWGLTPDAEIAPRGFWVTRPWSSAETCPATSAVPAALGTEPVTLPGQTLAIVSFGAGIGGSDRGYDAVVRVAQDKLDVSQGLRARISGRIDRLPDGRDPVRCIQPAGMEQRPICAIAAIFDELVVENPATGETLATWTLGKAGAARSGDGASTR